MLYLVLLGGFTPASMGWGGGRCVERLSVLAYNGALWMLLGRFDGLEPERAPPTLEKPLHFAYWSAPIRTVAGSRRAQTASVRHAASLAIYLSSTADIVDRAWPERPGSRWYSARLLVGFRGDHAARPWLSLPGRRLPGPFVVHRGLVRGGQPSSNVALVLAPATGVLILAIFALFEKNVRRSFGSSTN